MTTNNFNDIDLYNVVVGNSTMSIFFFSLDFHAVTHVGHASSLGQLPPF